MKSKQILVTVNSDFVAEEGAPFDAVFAALEHFEIPACLVEVSEPNAKNNNTLADALKICLGVIDWAIDHGGDKTSLEAIKKMSAEAISNYEGEK